MPKNKSSTKKSASKQAIQAGPSGKMHTFGGAGPQKSGSSAQATHSGKGAQFASGGPSGKMQRFTGVKPQKPGISSVTNSGYAKK